MKKMLLLISILLIIISIVWMSSPIQDRESPAYETWNRSRQHDFQHQSEMKKVFLSNTFSFKGLELIEVGPGEKYYSWWGHLLLRFVGSGAAPNEDITLSFLADFNDFPLNMIKASFGGYTVYPKIDTYGAFVKEYVEAEKRWMTNYPLQSSGAQREKVKLVVRGWLQDPRLPGTYAFFTNSCVVLLNKVLSQSGMLKADINPNQFYFPKDVAPFYRKVGLILEDDFKQYAKQ